MNAVVGEDPVFGDGKRIAFHSLKDLDQRLVEYFNTKSAETALLSPAVCYSAPLMEKRIIQLETLSTLQDETIEKLNKEIFRQQQDIAHLRRRIETIEQKMAELGEPEPVAGSERPPHY